jgi:hypothetical protein
MFIIFLVMGSEGDARRCELCGALLKRKDWQKHEEECPALEDVRQFIANVKTGVLRLREKWGDNILDEILYSLALDVIKDTIYAVKYRDTFTEKAPKWFKRCRRKFAKILIERMREEVEKRLERGEYTEIITKDGRRIHWVDWKGNGWFVVDGDLLWLPWMDHIKFTRDGKVISEPYTLDDEKVKKLIDFCEKTGLTFTITGDSYHFPTRTLRIIIHPPESDEHK